MRREGLLSPVVIAPNPDEGLDQKTSLHVHVDTTYSLSAGSLIAMAARERGRVLDFPVERC